MSFSELKKRLLPLIRVLILTGMFFFSSLTAMQEEAIEKSKCGNAFDKCMDNEGKLLNETPFGLGTVYCIVGYLWCITYVE